MPLYELLEELYSILHLNLVAKQDAYLFSFFDAVTQYLQDNPSDIGHFIRHWEDTLCAQTIPSGEVDGIRILSIHKSKGLEFHTVLIPFCDWKLENETNNQLVWCQARAKPLNVVEAHFAQVNGITATVTLELNGQRKVVTSVGNGRLDAVANAIQSATGMDFHLENYSEHSLDEGSTSRAASYVGLVWGDNTVTWGAGTDTDIIVAGIRALVSAINNR